MLYLQEEALSFQVKDFTPELVFLRLMTLQFFLQLTDLLLFCNNHRYLQGVKWHNHSKEFLFPLLNTIE